MKISLINQFTSLIALLGVTGSIFYLILIKIGFPKTNDGKAISKMLTFFSVLVMYFVYVLTEKIFDNYLLSILICFFVLLILPFIFSFIINKYSNALNHYSSVENGFYHQEGTPLLQFLKEKIDGTHPEKYIIVFDNDDKFIVSGFLDKLSDQDDSTQQVQLIGDHKIFTIKGAIELYNDNTQKYYEDKKIIYDFNRGLKIFCLNQ